RRHLPSFPTRRSSDLQLGRLVTAERREIESYRAIGNLMREYNELKKPERPLSIGVFGRPGAGKSTGVKELASAIMGVGQADVLRSEEHTSELQSRSDL